MLIWRVDLTAMTITYQHGDNPEAVMQFPAISAYEDPADRLRAGVYAWVDRIHEYQDR